MSKVYKYDLPTPGLFKRHYVGSVFSPLCVMLQDGTPRLWAEVSDDGQSQMIDVACVGTGWDIPELPMRARSYVGSVIDGEFVWHFYAYA